MDIDGAPPPLWTANSSSDSLSENEDEHLDFQDYEEPTLLEAEEPVPQTEDPLVETKQITESAIIHSREYQLEMLEESLKRNIVVTMETGTGKTQVAVLRIQAELERSTSGKIAWFLAPTVALGEQQTKVLRSQIPAVQIKFLSGADGVDTWSDTRTWNDCLRNVRVVVSTYQVLLDAVNHAFVRIDRLSLIVFDEAHNCRGKHAGAKIMARYHENKAAGLLVPSILGLTASPIIRSKVDSLEEIERTLDAVCKTPTIHRDQLTSVVKRPKMYRLFYSQPDYIRPTSNMNSLSSAYYSLDIYKDPTIIRLQRDDTERSRIELKKALQNRDTYVFNQLQSLWRKSTEIQRELGSWAADYFLHVTITQFVTSIKKNDSWLQGWEMKEKQYLAAALETVKISAPPPFKDDASSVDISDKVTVLTQQLSRAADGTIGIIFVREVATVAMLSHILSVHPSIKNRFRTGTMIGSSNYSGRKRDIGTLKRASDYQDLEDFRSGKLDILIATSVLEEGIDVPACNLVICFDRPDNLKAFIQRRGRARMRESKLILLLDNPTYQVDEWTAYEEEMKKRYEDDMRKVQELVDLEESEEPDVEPFFIPETGAQLDFDQAKSHLEHFCRTLSIRQYADLRPYYIYKRIQTSLKGSPQIRATVVLPMSLPPELRRVESDGFWFSEKNASKDAAFQAYIAIYKAGFLNDNLLPLADEITRDTQTRPGLTEVHEQWNPWIRIAHTWAHQTEVYQRRLRLRDRHGDIMCEFDASLPVCFPKIPDINIFWDRLNAWTIETSETKIISKKDLATDHSLALIDLANNHRNLKLRDSAQLILHIRSPAQDIPYQRLIGQKHVEEASLDGTVLIRNGEGYPCLFKAWLPSGDQTHLGIDIQHDGLRDVPCLMLERWPRRRDFLHCIPEDATLPAPSKPGKQKQTIWPAHLCRMDGIHISAVYFGALVPSITHIIEVYLVANELCNTILKDVKFLDLSLVATAISAPVAKEATDYQRIEFLGDSILKMFTTASVTANCPHFPEGYLDAIKTNIVSNSRLCRAAVEAGLDKFILTKNFTGAKWQPIYVEDLLKLHTDVGSKRTMSTKTLADVVEASIGAAYLDGGHDEALCMDKALICIRTFIPDVEWHSLDSARSALFSQTEMGTVLPDALAPLEELIGYRFRNKNLLIEASTHSSFGFVNAKGSCMERLEFLGDSILDSVIVSALWKYERDLSQGEMHLLRTATVNADLLGFLTLEWAIPQEATEISKNKTTIEKQTNVPFWKFMRHASPDMGTAQRTAEETHARERDIILEAIHHGTEYPWAQLAHLNIPKFFSDFFESVLGAVWVDSGSMDVCAQIVERAGILPYLQRLLADNVDVLHPKNHLGQLAGKSLKTVEYKTEVRETDGHRELFCRVIVAGEVLVEVGGGVNNDEIMTKAAYLAHKKLLQITEKQGKDVVDEDMVARMNEL
ncbi:hypothetical protein F5Y04DRAFT_245634 [Hypomontagnella monticulosa]|nr:hypothetical protein F5Y04DRAFT_245634 [Hypomontagnella monticulosa]